MAIVIELQPNQHVLSIAPEYYGIHHMPFDLENTPSPDRSYNCFINRICPNRQSWFYKLYDLDLNQGYVSFNVDYRDLPSTTYYDKLQIFDKLHTTYNTLFQRQYEATRDLIPFCNFQHVYYRFPIRFHSFLGFQTPRNLEWNIEERERDSLFWIFLQ